MVTWTSIRIMEAELDFVYVLKVGLIGYIDSWPWRYVRTESG